MAHRYLVPPSTQLHPDCLEGTVGIGRQPWSEDACLVHPDVSQRHLDEAFNLHGYIQAFFEPDHRASSVS